MEHGVRHFANLCQVLVSVDQGDTQDTFDRMSKAMNIFQRAISQTQTNNNEFLEIEEILGQTQDHQNSQKAAFTSPHRTSIDQRDVLLINLNEILNSKLNLNENILFIQKSLISQKLTLHL